MISLEALLHMEKLPVTVLTKLRDSIDREIRKGLEDRKVYKKRIYFDCPEESYKAEWKKASVIAEQLRVMINYGLRVKAVKKSNPVFNKLREVKLWCQ